MQLKHNKIDLNKGSSSTKRLSAYSMFSAALSIPALASTVTSHAQSATEKTDVKFFYGDYDDRQQGASRMHIKAPMVWIRSPLGDGFEAEGSMVWDSMSGASPYYHNTLTGASGAGVEDIRRAGDVKLTKTFDSFSLGIGSVASDEDDYTSVGGSIETRIWSEDKNTTLALGFGGNDDDISSSIQPNLDESRTTYNLLVGVTQVIDENSIVQSNITFTTGDGYFSDPYKTLDNRPRSRDQWAWLTRYNRYFADLDGALHIDYRLYTDSWEINSHMIELSWYQPLGSSFMVRPSFRYYSQDAAEFFTNTFPPDELERFISADQRVSGFGGITGGLKLIADIAYGFSADIGYSYLEQRSEWQINRNGSDVIFPFSAHWLTVGVNKEF